MPIAVADRPFDLFVIDMRMPDMNGDELARQLRRHDPDAKVLSIASHQTAPLGAAKAFPNDVRRRRHSQSTSA